MPSTVYVFFGISSFVLSRRTEAELIINFNDCTKKFLKDLDCRGCRYT